MTEKEKTLKEDVKTLKVNVAFKSWKKKLR